MPRSVRIPVTVLMNRHARDAGAWVTYEWLVESVLPDTTATDNERRGVVGRPARDDDDTTYIWHGLALEFFKDGCESYWYNFMSEAPRLFVMVDIDETDKARLLDLTPSTYIGLADKITKIE